MFFFLHLSAARATDYTNTNFIVRDPVITIEGGRSTTADFQYFSSSGQTDIGQSSSTDFIHRAGFLYFPAASSPSPTPTPSPSPSAGGGGGASGGGVAVPATNAVFSGRAYPKSTVTLLKDAQVAAATVAGADSKFQISLTGLSGGNYIFSVYAEDTKGYRSSLLSFPVSVTTGVTTNVSGIFIAPSIAVDKSEVKRGENIAIFGQSTPLGDITITVNSHEEFFEKTKADASGVYLLNFDTSLLAMEQHTTKSKAALGGEISAFGKTVSFIVGTRTVLAQLPGKTASKADLNNDKKVNLVDFSIAAYWYKRASPSASSDLNSDGKVDLVDFSIMAFYWTG